MSCWMQEAQALAADFSYSEAECRVAYRWLDAFKARVGASWSWNYFTRPDGVALAVIEALMGGLAPAAKFPQHALNCG